MKLFNVQLSEDQINKILEDMSALQASEGQYLRGPHITEGEKTDVMISVADREFILQRLAGALKTEGQPLPDTRFAR